MEGNSFLRANLVINEGQTISGKVCENIEISKAIVFIKTGFKRMSFL
jgi:hypothetical protein